MVRFMSNKVTPPTLFKMFCFGCRSPPPAPLPQLLMCVWVCDVLAVCLHPHPRRIPFRIFEEGKISHALSSIAIHAVMHTVFTFISDWIMDKVKGSSQWTSRRRFSHSLTDSYHIWHCVCAHCLFQCRLEMWCTVYIFFFLVKNWWSWSPARQILKGHFHPLFQILKCNFDRQKYGTRMTASVLNRDTQKVQNSAI